MSSQEKLIESIPLYLNGTLEREEKREFEESLKVSASLQRELEEFREIREFYSDLNKEIPAPSPEVFDRVMRSIEIKEERDLKVESPLSFKPVWEFVESLFKVPSFAWGLAGAQFAIILFLVSGAPDDQRYETLSSPPATVVLKDQISFKVVFNETAKESEIRKLLLSLGGQLVSGPSPVGSYTVAIKSSEDDVEIILNKLKTSPIVNFASNSF